MRPAVWVGAAIAVLLVAAVPAWLVLGGDDGERRAGAFSSGQTVAGKWALELGGVNVGPVQAVSGCGTDAEIVSEPAGQDVVVHKHVGQPRYDACVLDVGLSMSKPFYDWIRAALASNSQRKTVVLQQIDPVTGGEKLRLELFDAVVTGFTVPRLDTADTTPAWLRVSLAPELIRRQPGSGARVAMEAKAESLSPSTLRFELSSPGLLTVKSLGPWVFEQSFTASEVGVTRDYVLEPAKAEFGNLVVGSLEGAKGSPASALDTWFKSFVIDGHNDAAGERQATLSVSSATGKILTLSFQGVGIHAADPFAAADGVRRHGLYVESAALQAP
jgi:phage tail-like protein